MEVKKTTDDFRENGRGDAFHVTSHNHVDFKESIAVYGPLSPSSFPFYDLMPTAFLKDPTAPPWVSKTGGRLRHPRSSRRPSAGAAAAAGRCLIPVDVKFLISQLDLGGVKPIPSVEDPDDKSERTGEHEKTKVPQQITYC